MCKGYLEIIGLNDMGHRREKSEHENWHTFSMSSWEEGIFVSDGGREVGGVEKLMN